MYKFAAASETELTVFGAARPGYKDRQVVSWIDFMKKQNIDRVCCLLAANQLAKYSNLLDNYEQQFGQEQVCWTPIKDFHFVDRPTLIDKILPFLITTEEKKQRVVVHCSGGIGRTGQILTAWLVARRGLSVQKAISTVQSTGRNPYEAIYVAILRGQNPWQVAKAFNNLLNDCR